MTAATPARDRGQLGRLLFRLAPLWGLVLLLVAWEGIVAAFRIPVYLLPAPSGVLARLAADPGYLIGHLAATAVASIGGLTIAIALACVLAVIITRSRLLERVVFPYLVLIQVTPIVAIAPLLVIWLGTGLAPKVAIAALIAFFPIVVNITAGLKSADFQTLELLHSFAASEAQVFRYVRVPFAVPYAFAAFRIAAPVSVIGAIVGEMVASNTGLGFVIMRAKGILDTELLFLGIFGSALLGITLFLLFAFLELRVVGVRRRSG